jgi:NAD(P)H-hydrate epimerase
VGTVEADVKLVSVAEMIAIEQEADANGLTYERMMENAGQGLAEEISESFDSMKEGGILGLIGSGNNGGDTLIALEKLSDIGWRAAAYIVNKRPPDDPLISRLVESGGNILKLKNDPDFESLTTAMADYGIILDGILGTGIKLPLRGKVSQVLQHVQEMLKLLDKKPIIVAVDCPSGVDCDTGEAADQSLAADVTITMAAVKRGLLEFPANNLLGELKLVGIGLDSPEIKSPAWDLVKREVVNADWVRNTLPHRPRDAHKGTFGTVMIVAGSINYTGAALLAGKAAYRSGVGLVEMAIPASLHSALAGHFPEGIWLLLPHEMGIIAEGGAEVVLNGLERTTAILIGPGLGQETETECFLDKLVSNALTSKRSEIGFVAAMEQSEKSKKVELPPLVIDADGLKLLARIQDWQKNIREKSILTPHPGEMAILTGLKVSKIQSKRLEIAERYAKEWGHVLVLKGANTVITEPDGRTAVIPVADPALARAGTGDVLAGIIVGLRGQGLGAFEAAVSGCWIHAYCGLKAADDLGTSTSVIAGDLVEYIPEIMRGLELSPQ